MEKSLNEKEYFIFDKSLMPDGTYMLPFSVYVFNKKKQTYDLVSFPNIPFSKNELNFDDSSYLALKYSDKSSFFNFFKINPWTIPSEINGVSEEEAANIPLYQIKFEFSRSLETNKFMPFILRIREEILKTIPDNATKEASFCKKMVEKALVTDNNFSILTSISILIFKLAKLEPLDDLISLIMASFFHHAGLTQISYKLNAKSYFELDKKERKHFHKHQLLSIHLMKKLDIPILSEKVFKIISEHHERYDGNGHPDGKKADKINPLSLILGFASHIIDFSSGKVNGKKVSIKHTILLIKSKSSSDGLEHEFGSIIKEIINDF